jgi:6-phosphogluconolactonase (cycloisomerase 2 family)
MKRIRMALAVAGILSLSMGVASCVNSSNCQCATSSAASKFAYVMLETDTIAAFGINANTGALTPVTGSPFGGNISPFYGASDPAGKFLYAVDQFNGRIYGFSIDQTTGALTGVEGSPFTPRASEAVMPIVDPTGSFLYVTNLDTCGDDCKGAVSAFKIAPDGSLIEMAGSPYTTDYGTFGIAMAPSGKFLYTMNGRNCCRAVQTVSAFQVDPVSGALTAIDGSPFSAGGIASFAAFHPSGNFLYVIVSGEGTAVQTFSINPTTGALSSTDSFVNLGQNPQGIDVDTIDDFLFVANNGSTGAGRVDGSIQVFHIDATTGALTQVLGSPFTTTGSNPLQPAVDRSCKYLYVTNNNVPGGTAADYVLAFAIDPITGNLTGVPGSPFATSSGGAPQGIVLTPHQSTTTP